MNKKIGLKNSLFTLGVLSLAFGASLLLQFVLDAAELISAVFVLGVFIVAYFTDGYVYGILASTVSMLAINFAFALPFFKFNFTLPENVLSAIIFLSVTLPTCALTARIKKWESMRAETEREKMRANLLRAVSHDLRTPLTTIYGSATAIMENYDTLTDEQKRNMLAAITEDADWLVRIVENLLSVTRLDTTCLKLKKSPIVVEELIDTTVSKFRKRYPDAPLKINIPEDFLTVNMDATLIEQVLLNLLENAVIHSTGMKNLTLNVYNDGSSATFEVSDDGCGISSELMPKIFTSFIHSDDRTHGMGIGLSVCATIIKAHGSEISAKNNEGGGVTFSFKLPTEDAEDFDNE